MSIQRQNYDQLVNLDGTYGINIAEGIFPGSGNTPGIKGNKGEDGLTGSKGTKGQKGTAGTGFAGTKGTKGQKGAEGIGDLGPKGQKGAPGTAANKGNKGDKGTSGTKGQKGQDAASPVFTFMGQVDNVNQLPATGNQVGDVYQTTDDDFLYAWNGTEWVTIAEAIGVVKGDKGDDGEKGTAGSNGNKGQKGAAGVDGATGQKGTSGTNGTPGAKGAKGNNADKGQKGSQGDVGPAGGKGEKGQKGADVETDLYYTKGQVDGLIEDFRPAQDAFNLFQYSDNQIIQTGTVDFDSVDANDTLYAPGVVTISSAVTVNNAPFDAFRYMVVNFVNSGGGVDPFNTSYAIVQQVYNASPGAGTAVQGAFRYVKPAGGEKSEWHQTTIDPGLYATNNELNDKSTYQLLAQSTDDNQESVLLQQGTSPETVSQFNLLGSGGIQLSDSGNNTIKIDGSALSGQNTFQGGITTAQNPADLDTEPQGGDYFIFSDTGTAWNGNAVQAGDWAIYNASANPPEWITLDYAGTDPGVTELSVTGGILTQAGTEAAPVIGLTNQNLTDAGMVDTTALGNTLRDQSLEDLNDVEFSYTFGGPGKTALFNVQIADNTKPSAAGEYSCIPGENAIWFYQEDARYGQNYVINFTIQDSTAGDQWLLSIGADATAPSSTITVVYDSFVQDGGTRKVVFQGHDAVSFADGAGQLNVKGPITATDISEGDTLLYNQSSGKFVPGPVATDLSAYAVLDKTVATTNTFNNAQVFEYYTPSGTNSAFKIEGRTTQGSSDTSGTLFAALRGSATNKDRDKLVYNSSVTTGYSSNEIINGAFLNDKLSGYMPNTGDVTLSGANLQVVSSNSSNGRISATGTDSKGVIVFPTGIININGASSSLNMTGAQTSTMNIGTQIASSELVISTTNSSGGSWNNERGTVRIGVPNSSGVNVFQVFGQLGSGQGQNQLLAVKTNGQISALNSTTALSSLANDSLVPAKALSSSLSGAVPVGTVMQNVSSVAPNGWYKSGQSFDVATHPLLHAALQYFSGYVSGIIPTLPAQTGLHAIIKNDNYDG